jgi:hypothetical protein
LAIREDLEYQVKLFEDASIYGIKFEDIQDEYNLVFHTNTCEYLLGKNVKKLVYFLKANQRIGSSRLPNILQRDFVQRNQDLKRRNKVII